MSSIKISNFIREKGYASVEDLIDELKVGAKPLISQVVESLALSDTCFYRDYDVFNRFENSVLPNLRENNRAAKNCVSGVWVVLPDRKLILSPWASEKILGLDDWKIDIIGTDISSVAISKAQRGLYSNFEVQMGLNVRTILDCFHKDGEQWMVNDDIRKMVEFRRYNLLDDIALTDKFEVIFCRNVLRFFTPEYQRQILARLSNSQTQGGILYLGKNEHIPCVDEFYEKLSGYNCVYMSRGISMAKLKLVQDPREMLAEDEEEMPSFVRPSGIFKNVRSYPVSLTNSLSKRTRLQAGLQLSILCKNLGVIRVLLLSMNYFSARPGRAKHNRVPKRSRYSSCRRRPFPAFYAACR